MFNFPKAFARFHAVRSPPHIHTRWRIIRYPHFRKDMIEYYYLKFLGRLRCALCAKVSSKCYKFMYSSIRKTDKLSTRLLVIDKMKKYSDGWAQQQNAMQFNISHAPTKPSEKTNTSNLLVRLLNESVNSFRNNFSKSNAARRSICMQKCYRE